MISRLIADSFVVIHFSFIVFVVLGGLPVLRWPKLIWVHFPCVIWGILIEFTGWICPLTPLEILFREKGGMAGYQGGFINHYILPLIYPEGLTRRTQILLGIAVLIINLYVYTLVFKKRLKNNVMGKT